MQRLLPFGTAGEAVAVVRDTLATYYGRPQPPERLGPLHQLVRSALGCKTLDSVSWAAYRRLVATYRGWSDLARASPEEIEAVIADVSHASVKALRIRDALRVILSLRGDFDLDFLGGWPVDAAFTWLERLPGVGPKVAAATLNFSTLERRAFVADTHVLRVLHRYGVLGGARDAWRAHAAVTAAAEAWSAMELTEFHVLLKRHGQARCRHTSPACCGCPLVAGCLRATPALNG